MTNRRAFIKQTAALGTLSALGVPPSVKALSMNKNNTFGKNEPPLVIATWNTQTATQEAIRTLRKGGSALDAVENGVKIEEANPDNQTVGYGGLPDRDGIVTLDACIMDAKGNAGSVTYLQDIKHPISVARKVMEDTPHVMLSGEGAYQFALEKGFQKENLLSEKSKTAWEKWLVEKEYKPIPNIERHDTIGMLAVDQNGVLAGACTTSGMAYKMHGRVGDSPIIGAGLFVDGEIGGAVATGLGELVMKTLGAFLIVELMRQGADPQSACEEAVKRIADKFGTGPDAQVGYIALRPDGAYGAFSMLKGFNYALGSSQKVSLNDAKAYVNQ